MLQVRGVKVEAVVIYCEPLTTKEMEYYRLSHRANNTVKKDSFLDITGSWIQYIGNKWTQRYGLLGFTQISSCCLCNYEVVFVAERLPEFFSWIEDRKESDLGYLSLFPFKPFP